MNFDLIIGGILIICFSACMAFLYKRQQFRVLILTFTCFWATVVAIHFWGLSANYVRKIFSGLHFNMIYFFSFWGVFLIAIIPCIVYFKLTHPPDDSLLPTSLNEYLHWASSIMLSILVTILLAMSITMLFPKTRAKQGKYSIQKYAQNCLVKLYLNLGYDTVQERSETQAGVVYREYLRPTKSIQNNNKRKRRRPGLLQAPAPQRRRFR